MRAVEVAERLQLAVGQAQVSVGAELVVILVEPVQALHTHYGTRLVLLVFDGIHRQVYFTGIVEPLEHVHQPAEEVGHLGLVMPQRSQHLRQLVNTHTANKPGERIKIVRAVYQLRPVHIVLQVLLYGYDVVLHHYLLHLRPLAIFCLKPGSHLLKLFIEPLFIVGHVEVVAVGQDNRKFVYTMYTHQHWVLGAIPLRGVAERSKARHHARRLLPVARRVKLRHIVIFPPVGAKHHERRAIVLQQIRHEVGFTLLALAVCGYARVVVECFEPCAQLKPLSHKVAKLLPVLLLRLVGTKPAKGFVYAFYQFLYIVDGHGM